MTELNKLGKVYTSDVLIIGGGICGMVAALKLKKLNSNLDVLVVEQGYHGYNGQSTKAGHGMFYMSPEDDLDEFCEEQVKNNDVGLYLNDQEYMYDLTKEAYTYIQELEELGAHFTYEEDGSLHYHKEFPTRKNSSVNIDLDYMVPFAVNALGAGVRVVERTYFTDLLKDGDKVVGAVGFNLDTMEFCIFHAKAVLLASNGFSPVVTGMFLSPATSLIAAYEAGAQLRNPEFNTSVDVGFRNTKNFMYGVHWVMCNRLGENVFQKYGCTNLENPDTTMIRGLLKEVELGNNPFYIDFSALPQHSETEGEGFTMGILMPVRLGLDEFIHDKHLQDIDMKNPEITLTMYVNSYCLRANIEAKTSVPNLWAAGMITLYGAAHGSWVHGDGVGYASRTALLAARSIAKDIDDIELGKIDVEQVKFFKDRIYAPLNYKGEKLPYSVTHYLDRLICVPENSVNKTEESIHAVLCELREMRQDLPNLMHVPEGDGHYLARAVDARTNIDMLEIMFMAYDMRKESRGFHMRADYPERDDKNMLKWIVVNRNEDGTPNVHFERIPFERYKFKPEGWTPDEAAAG